MGVLLPVCRAYKSRQKVGRQTFSATRNGGEGKTERGIPRPTKRHPDKCKVSTENGNRFTEGEKDIELETNGYQDRKRLAYRQIQSDGQVHAPGMRAPQRSFGKGATGRRRTPRVSLRTLPRPEFCGATRGLVVGSRPWKEERGAVGISHLSEARGELEVCSS